jgi:serine/threonine protein kinase/formylglycine-generating enzyme required for sulfatase activity
MQHGPITALFQSWTPPKAFDEYRILRQLGRGGMGEVYLAQDTLLDRLVAVKFIGTVEPDEAAREQFLTEARAAARIQHPNVLTVYRVGELDDKPFILSEFIRGKSLDQIDRRMPWKKALELGIGLSRGLAAAHRHGVLHRDIKPGNAIIADDGTVKLLDFGLAKFIDVSALQDEVNGPSSTEPAPVSKDAPTIGLEDVRRTPERGPVSSPRRARKAVVHVEPAASPDDSPTIVTVERDPDSTEKMREEDLPPPSLDPSSMVRGTPHYMAPELWRGEPATRRSDVYSLGALLFELCAGAPPYMGTPLNELPRVVAKRSPKPLAEVVPSVDRRFAAIVDRCLRRDPAERFGSGDELREALEQLTPAASATAPLRESIPEGNPYRGLLPFEAEHRALFFGRTTEIGTILERLRAESFVLVAGDSGVGKSSLCRAGVLPLATDGALGGGREWSSVSFVPGKRPLASLAAAFAGVLGTEEEKLTARLRLKPTALARDLGKKLGDEHGLVIFIDQLEELATVSRAAEAAIVGEALAQLCARIPGVRLLMTVRSDFLARIAAVPGLGDELSRALYFLRPLSPEKIREAIVGPARAKGVSFESDALVDALIDSAVRAEGSLPLLQFALAELWEARAGAKAPITADALEQIGGVAGALARHADQVLLRLPTDQRRAARRILIALVTLEGTRARRTEEELVGGDAAARAALEGLVAGRLLAVRDAEGGTAYEVAHEALLKGWKTLRRWLDEQADSRAVTQRLEMAAAEWDRLGRTSEALWSARQLAEAAIIDAGELGARDAAFLEASRQKGRRDRAVRNAILVGAPILLCLLYGAIQIKASHDLGRRVSASIATATTSVSAAHVKDAEVMRLREEAFAAFDRSKREEGEEAWARALALGAEVDRIYGRASQALETALSIDASREDVRAMLGDVLYARALAAERDRRTAQRDDLIERLSLYDVSGERRKKWSAPARLSVESSPPGTRVTIERFTADEGGALHLTDERDLGAAPVAETELPQGSIVLSFAAAGRAPVRYPVLLGRDERLHLSVDLPLASEVPEGYVYIPPGRFLFGSSVDESFRRQFFATVPMHEVTTGAYLIARNETTFDEWLSYLRALPAGERARRALRVDESVLTGGLDLRELPSGVFELMLRPTTQALTAREGEMVSYRSRGRRAVQDWRRFPVMGISREDAVAYTTWLDSTRRVPGARLCTEHEWERAARGADARELPAGDKLAPDDANIDETYNKEGTSLGPDEVGSHPASRSPFGLDDMAGNVLEWVRSSLGPEDMLLRGGCYFYDQWTARSTNRVLSEATVRDPRVGIRVCATVKSR